MKVFIQTDEQAGTVTIKKEGSKAVIHKNAEIKTESGVVKLCVDGEETEVFDGANVHYKTIEVKEKTPRIFQYKDDSWDERDHPMLEKMTAEQVMSSLAKAGHADLANGKHESTTKEVDGEKVELIVFKPKAKTKGLTCLYLHKS